MIDPITGIDDGTGTPLDQSPYVTAPDPNAPTDTTGGIIDPTTGQPFPVTPTIPYTDYQAASSGSTPWTTDLVKGFNNLTGLNLSGSQLAGLGLGALSLYSSLSQPAYNPKTPSQLLAMQPSNTPGAFSQAQMAAMQVPIKSGNQSQKITAADMASPDRKSVV